MFKNIAVALDESPEAKRAFHAALDLAGITAAEICIVTVVENLPAYISYVSTVAPNVPGLLRDERRAFYDDLHSKATRTAAKSGISVRSEIVEGSEIAALLQVLEKIKPDLLVVGLRGETGGSVAFWVAPPTSWLSTQGAISSEYARTLPQFAGLLGYPEEHGTVPAAVQTALFVRSAKAVSATRLPSSRAIAISSVVGCNSPLGPAIAVAQYGVPPLDEPPRITCRSFATLKIRLTGQAHTQAACEPSQKGLLAERPHRHKVTRFRTS
jgi:nucleotide-binding universal stress UspA family protein